MSTANKYMQSASGVGGVLNVEDVFSTYLYTGNGSTQTITNNVDLSGEGGLVWIKSRAHSYPHALFDTERGATKQLKSSSSVAERTLSTLLTSFNNNGFSLGSDSDVNGTYSPAKYASWTFRKAPKFFDVVTYTGDGTNNRQIAHNLGAVPGCIIIKMRSGQKDWKVYHRGIDSSNPENYKIHLNETAARSDGSTLFDAPTDTHFVLDSNDDVNGNGDTHVAYLFAHNNNDGKFGPDSDQDIIKCGSYTGNTTTGPVIDLGFEPQWLLIKPTSYAGDGWFMFDSMRGIVTGAEDARIYANNNNSENTGNSYVDLTATGFKPRESGGACNTNGENYIYIAIRRPTAVPTSATEVFNVEYANQSGTGKYGELGAPVDMFMQRTINSVENMGVRSRLTGGNYLWTPSTDAERTSTTNFFDNMTGVGINGTSIPTVTTLYSWMWKRAPKYFDVVAYTGTSGAQTLNHNLGVTPELIIVKARESSIVWAVWSKSLEQYELLQLNTSNAKSGTSGDYGYWTSTAPTNTQFSVGTYDTANKANEGMIAYLFATLAGISKVGSYTGNGTTLNIDCGFSSGARFVLIKRTDSTGSWWVFDTERGLVAGADAAINLDTTAAEFSTVDYIDPYSAGFSLTGIGGDFNANGGSYIFYAIA